MSANIRNRYNLYPRVNNSNDPDIRSKVIDRLLSEQSGFLDIETLDTAGGAPIHQVGYLSTNYNYNHKVASLDQVNEYIPKPSARKGGYKWDRLDVDPTYQEPVNYGYDNWKQAYADYQSSFTEKMLKEQRGLWGYLEGDPIAAERTAVLNDLEVTINRDINTPIGDVIRDLIENKFGNRTIWLMNAEFESKMFTSHLSPNTIQNLKRFQAVEGNTLHDFMKVTDPFVLAARKYADDTNDYSVLWDATKKSLFEHTKRSGYQVLDLQDVIKGFQGYGLKVSKAYDLGIDFKDINRGIKLDIFSHLLFGEIEAHSGVEDSELTRRVLNKIGNYADILASMLDDQGNALPIAEFSKEQKEALSVIQRVAQTKTVAKDFYAVSHVNRILMDEYTAAKDGHKFTHRMFDQNRTKHAMKKVYREVKDAEGKIKKVPEHISVPILEAQFQIYESVDEALDRLQRMPGNEDINIKKLYAAQKQMAEVAAANGIDPSVLLKSMNDQVGDQLMTAIRGMKFVDTSNDLKPNVRPVVKETITEKIAPEIKTKRQLEETLLKEPSKSYESLVGARQTESYERFIKYFEKGKYPFLAGALAFGALSFVSSFGETDIEPPPTLDTTWDSMQDDPTVTSTRHEFTDFGSPYRKEEGTDLPSFKAIREKLFGRTTPVYMFGMRIDDRIVDFAEKHTLDFQKDEINYLQTQEQLEGYRTNRFFQSNEGTFLNKEDYANLGLTRNKKLKKVDAKQFDIEVEDADTILLHPKSGIGKTVSIRMTGIDAPEISHPEEKMAALRFDQSQPYGEEARDRLKEMIENSSSIEVVYDPKDDTYGRQLGVVVGDGLNLNTQLVREGWVKSLPFGKTNEDIISRYRLNHLEELAAQRDLGMWQSDFWKAERQTASTNFRLTNNTLTRLDKLSNMNVAATFTAFQLSSEGELQNYPTDTMNQIRSKVQSMRWPSKPKKTEPKEVKYFNYSNTLATLNYREVMEERPISYGNQIGLENRLGRSAQINDYIKIDSTTFSNSPYSENYSSIGAQQRKNAQMQKRREYMAQQRMANESLNNYNKQGMMQHG